MAVTAYSGPLVVFGQAAAGGDYNPDLGTSLFWGGSGILDPRLYYTYLPGEAQSAPDLGWLGVDDITTLSIVPYTKAAAAIVASANPTSATLALVSASSATTGVYITPSIMRGDTGAIDTGVGGAGLVALDAYTSVTASCASGVLTITANAAMPVSSGMVLLTAAGAVSSGTVAGTVVTQQLSAGTGGLGVAGTYQTNNSSLSFASGTVTLALQNPFQCAIPMGNQTPSIYLWNPMSLIGRAVAVTAAAGATYATATVSGYDIYGFPMVEAITISAGGQAVGKKAFRYIRSVVLSGGVADTTHAYSVDTTDVFGLPLRSDSFGDIQVNYATSLTAVTAITAATSYLPADRTVPATTTTGDVRGTYAAFTSSTGANKLIIRQSIQPYNIGFNAGLFGVAQYANF